MKYNNKPVNYFDNRPTKKYLENHIYTKIGKMMTSKALIVTGPALGRHIKNGIKIASNKQCKILCIEIEPRIFKEMQKRLVKIKKQYLQNNIFNINNVEIGLGDVIRYEDVFESSLPCRFEDLDFCESLHNSRFTIGNRLNVQSINYNSRYASFRKFLMFNASVRPFGIENYLYDLNMIIGIIGARLSIKRTMRQKRILLKHGVQKLQPVLIKRGRLSKDYPLQLYIYKDTSAMICCTIMYK